MNKAIMSSDTPILVHVLTAFGDRYPDNPESAAYRQLFGDETPVDLLLYRLGKQFREVYKNYLDTLYIPEYVDIWSTEYTRTRRAAEDFLTGLFQPAYKVECPDNFNRPPMQINYIPIEKDNLLGASFQLEKFRNAYYKVYETDFGKYVLKKHESLKAYVTEHTGQQITYISQLTALFCCFSTEVAYGLPLPEWGKLIYPDILLNAVMDELRLKTSTKELKRYLYGNLLKKILIDSQNKIKNKSSCKLHLYVAHRGNITYALVALGLWYVHDVTYAASLTFEVHEVNGRYGIRIFHKRHVDGNFELRTFINGQTILWMEDLENIVNDLFTDENEANSVLLV